MPAAEKTALAIVCDNEACPGNDLPKNERTGWIFVSGEVYGEPTLPQLVVCSFGCLATFTKTVAAKEEVSDHLKAWVEGGAPTGDTLLPEEEATPTKTGRLKK